MDEEKSAQWAIVELMGHAQTAGRISRPDDWGGLLRVDVPDGETYRTEYYGMPAIYAVKLVSEEIARAYARREPEAIEYDAPIVTRGQYQKMQETLQQRLYSAQQNIAELERRLTSVNALPERSSLFDGDQGEEEDQDS